MLNYAKKLFHRLLSHMDTGTLTLIENGLQTQFGQGEPHAKMIIHDANVYLRALYAGSNGLADAYICGEWETDDLTGLLTLALCNKKINHSIDGLFSQVKSTLQRLIKPFQFNSVSKAKEHIHAHYDLSNSFFRLFLDQEYMMYSSAIFDKQHTTLEAAAENKLRLICDKLQLSATDHLLEIGSGWGGMAIYAAQHIGCRVTTVTISDAQYNYAQEKISDAKLENKITLLNRDYRKLEGKFDKLVSIEMIEAVGYQHYPEFFKKCNSLLKENGLFCMQAITIRDQIYHRAKREDDFIKRLIFPGGCLPSVAEIGKMVCCHTEWVWCEMTDISTDYCKTLAIWQQRFTEQVDKISALGFDDTFIRAWQYYFSYCQAGFSQQHIGDMQILWKKNPLI